MNDLHRCPMCEGKGKNKQGYRCPCCKGFGQVGEVGINRYRLCRDLERIEKEGKIKNFPMSNPDLSWEV